MVEKPQLMGVSADQIKEKRLQIRNSLLTPQGWPTMKHARNEGINLASELRSGRHYGVFIDDTGSPGLAAPGLHSNRKSWAAVLVPPHQMPEVLEQLPSSLSVLTELGVEKPEFHFTDIWAGKGEFRNLDLQHRLAIFRFMAFIFEKYEFRVIVQTFDPDNSAEIVDHPSFSKSLGPLKLDNYGDLALVFALVRVKIHLQESIGENVSACAVVDEGRFSSGYTLAIPALAPTFVFGSVLFANSRVAHPLQLADFAAFVMNRWQLLRVKESLSDLDKTFLEIVSPIVNLFINLHKAPVVGWPDLTNLSKGLD